MPILINVGLRAVGTWNGGVPTEPLQQCFGSLLEVGPVGMLSSHVTLEAQGASVSQVILHFRHGNEADPPALREGLSGDTMLSVRGRPEPPEEGPPGWQRLGPRYAPVLAR